MYFFLLLPFAYSHLFSIYTDSRTISVTKVIDSQIKAVSTASNETTLYRFPNSHDSSLIHCTITKPCNYFLPQGCNKGVLLRPVDILASKMFGLKIQPGIPSCHSSNEYFYKPNARYWEWESISITRIRFSRHQEHGINSEESISTTFGRLVLYNYLHPMSKHENLIEQANTIKGNITEQLEKIFRQG